MLIFGLYAFTIRLRGWKSTTKICQVIRREIEVQQLNELYKSGGAVFAEYQKTERIRRIYKTDMQVDVNDVLRCSKGKDAYFVSESNSQSENRPLI